MAVIVDMPVRDDARHLYWKWDRSKFITLCGGESVIFEGRVMSIAEATSYMLENNRATFLLFWEE